MANNKDGIVANNQQTLLFIPICSWTTSRRLNVFDQNVVKRANNEKKDPQEWLPNVQCSHLIEDKQVLYLRTLLPLTKQLLLQLR